MKNFYVYILTNRRNGTLYTGITSNLIKRVQEHKNKLVEGFTKKYSTDKLVYYEQTTDAQGALAREKHFKRWKRAWKIELIEKENPTWRDLYNDIIK